jgi:hypothetical protein
MVLHLTSRSHPGRERAPERSRTGGPSPSPPEDAAGRSVGGAVAVAVAALLLGALLNAEALEDTASAQPFGWRRDVASAAVSPLLEVSRTLRLTAPRRWLEDALDRPHPRTEEPRPPATTTTTTRRAEPGAPAPTTTTTTADDLARRVPSAEAPLRLLVAGDSMTEALGPVLLARADATGVVAGQRELRYSSGLTRPDYFDWPAELGRLLERDDPEAVVIMLGANDAQAIMTGQGPAAFGTPAWVTEYRARVAGAMDSLAADGRTVYWVGQPIMRSAGFDQRMQLVTRIYREEAARRAGIRFLDTRPLFAVDGGYTAYLPGANGDPVLVRREDGIHLTPAGAERLATAVLAAIGRDWTLPGGG